MDDKFDENGIVNEFEAMKLVDGNEELKEKIAHLSSDLAKGKEENKILIAKSQKEVNSLQEALKNANVEISALKEKLKICEQKEDIFPEEEVSEFFSHDFTFQSTETAAAESSQSSEAVESILKEIPKESTTARNSTEKENDGIVESEIEVLQTENQKLKQSQEEVGQREPAKRRQQEETERQLQRGFRAAHRPLKRYHKVKNSERERGRKRAAESAARKKQRQRESLDAPHTSSDSPQTNLSSIGPRRSVRLLSNIIGIRTQQ